MSHSDSTPGRGLSRRSLLQAAGTAVVGVSATSLSAAQQQASPLVTFRSGEATIGGYLARPATAMAPLPGIVVIHENQGVTDYILETARELAQAGYATLAINLCSRALGPEAPGGTDAARQALQQLSTEHALADLGAAVDYLKARDDVRTDRLGVVGFCYGGRLSILLAGHRPDVRASVIFYGRLTDAVPVAANVQAAVMGHFGEADGAIPLETITALEEALKEHGKTVDFKVFPGARHAFHRPGGNNHHPEAAREAWERTLAWFNQHLRQGS